MAMCQNSAFVDFKALKARISIEQVLERYGLLAALRKTGDRLGGPCPLHGGTNPTHFRVSISKNCWNCFGTCRGGGNVIDFVARKENVPFRDAAILIQGWFAAPREPALPPVVAEKARPPEHSEAEAPEQPQDELDSDSPAEPNLPLKFALKNLDPAHPYLRERGLTDETIAEFGLGFCSKGSMRGRIVIPIHNAEGELVGYVGRFPGEPPADKPKYQLPKGFRKSQEVFNLHRAIGTDPGTPLIVVEGYFDCMRIVQAGIRRVVALMGSSLSGSQEDQIAQLVGSNGRVALMFDQDDAGRAIREQALRRLAPRAFVRILELKDAAAQPDQLSDAEIKGMAVRDDIVEYKVPPSKFPLGRFVATAGAVLALEEPDVTKALMRHMRGDWGDLDEHDKAANDRALIDGERLFSVYSDPNGTRFYIITEADRSATTVLLPEEY